MERKVKVEISLKSIVSIIGVLLGLFILWQIRGILVGLIVAYVLMSSLAPLVDYFHNNLKINKGISILITYLIAVLFLGTLSFLIIPPLVSQVDDLFKNLPYFLSNATRNIGLVGTEKEAADYARNLVEFTTARWDTISGQVIQITLGVFSGVFAFFTIAVLTFFLLLERDKIKQNIFLLIPNLPRARATKLAHEIERKIGAWFVGQLLLGLIIGVFTWIGLTILGVPYALPLSVVAGVLELVPIIGPILSSIPAIIVALVVSPLLGLIVAVYFLIIQQIENSILVPKVMERAVGLSPIITLLALLVGSSLLGVVGALLSVPIAAGIKVVVDDYLENKDPK